MANYSGSWHFPGNRNAQVLGLDNGGIDNFDGIPIEGLAREVVQNSIDAQRDASKPVRVVFDYFESDIHLLPDMVDLEKEIDNCIESCDPEERRDIKRLNEMKNSFTEKISCLRISDFNTTGLEGVRTKEFQKSPFRDLVRGEGKSGKGSNKGGSKGLGKNAAFVNSSFRTVFYSTLDTFGNEGYIGLARLCSAKYDAPDAKVGEQTMGIGYYANSSDLDSIPGQLILGNNTKRNEPGTDIYILGFITRNNWANKIISELLDSFMCAFYYGNLDVEIDGKHINKKTLKKYIANTLITDPSKPIGKKIILQYNLLSKKASHFLIDLGQSYKADFYFLNCENEYRDYALGIGHNCFFVRSPYMKVNEKTINSRHLFIGLCIIGDNELNDRLKDIENVRHNTWEPEKIVDEEECKDIKRLLDLLYSKIGKIVSDQYEPDDYDLSELPGVAKFIPLNSNGNSKSYGHDDREEKQLNSTPYLTSKISKNVDINAQFDDTDGEGISPDLGSSINVDSNDAIVPDSHNGSQSGGERIGNSEGNSYNEGYDHAFFRHADLGSMPRYFVATNPKEGSFAIIITSPQDVDNVRIELKEVGGSDETERVLIYHASIDDEDLELVDHCIVNLSLCAGVKTVINVKTNKNELFAGEVRINEYK